MGGYGSGRTGGKPLVQEAIGLDIGWLCRHGHSVPAQYRTGRLSWRYGASHSGSVRYECDMRDCDNARLVLYYSYAGQPKTQSIKLVYTRPHYGGRRWWMICPVTGKRAAKLYCPAGASVFASRTAYGMAYRSQRQDHLMRQLERLDKVYKLLGTDMEMGVGEKPKGMWNKRYRKLLGQYALEKGRYNDIWTGAAKKLLKM